MPSPLPTKLAAVSANATMQITVVAMVLGKKSKDRQAPKTKVTGPNAIPRVSNFLMLDLVTPPRNGNEYPFTLRASEII